MTLSGTIKEISKIKVTKSGLTKKELLLQPRHGKAFTVQFHRDRMEMLQDIQNGERVDINVKIIPAGTTGTVNLVANGIKIYSHCES